MNPNDMLFRPKTSTPQSEDYYSKFQPKISHEEDFRRLQKFEEKQSKANNPNLFSRLLESGIDKAHDAMNWLIETHKNTKEPNWNMGGLSSEDLINLISPGGSLKFVGNARNIIANIIKSGKLKGGQFKIKPPPKDILGKGKPAPRNIKESPKESYGWESLDQKNLPYGVKPGPPKKLK